MLSIDFLKNYWLCIILLLIGSFFLFITYIAASMQSKRSSKNVSGVPGIGGIFIALAFLTTPYKWLMILGLLDWQILWFIFKVLPDYIHSEKELRNRQFPEMLNGEKIIAHTGYKPKYNEVHITDKGKRIIHVYSICYYAISECSAEYSLLSVDVNFNIIKRDMFKTVDECKNQINPKIKWFDN